MSAKLKSRAVKLAALSGGVGAALAFQSYRRQQHPDSYTPFTTGLGLGQAYYYGGSIFRYVINPEQAHVIGVKSLALSRRARYLLGLIDDTEDGPVLRSTVLGMEFDNPIGISAGFDKHAECMAGLYDSGFGFVEIGSVTPLPQPGNEKPRVFRLQEDQSIINRYGFNSEGIQAVTQRLQQYLHAKSVAQGHRQQPHPAASLLEAMDDTHNKVGPLGLNLGKNKTSTDAVADYVIGIQTAGSYADYIVVNVSSPNTPGLRSLQAKKELYQLLNAVKKARDAVDQQSPIVRVKGLQQHSNTRRPLLVKIAPDLSEADKQDIAETVTAVGFDGLIISNTTLARPDSLKSVHRNEIGGLSGPPLFEMSTALVADMYKRTKGKIPIIGVGGISDADQAYAKIKAGASLVQLYTAFSYNGPALIHDIKSGLKQRLQRDGYKHVSDAVGVDADKYGGSRQTLEDLVRARKQ